MTVPVNLEDYGPSYYEEIKETLMSGHSERQPNDVRADMGMEAREMPPIDRAFRDQAREIEGLVDEVSALLEVINPFMTPESDEEKSGQVDTMTRKPASQITHHIEDNTRAIAYQVRRLNEARHRVEL